MKRVFSLLLAVMLVMTLAVPAMAAEGRITYEGKNKILITPASTTYTDSDMFDDFKGVMPGDVLVEQVRIYNVAADNDFVRVHLQAIPHGETNNPSLKVQAAGETVGTMNDFLNQLHMEVTCGGDVVFSGSPASGSDSVYLGYLRRFKSMYLDVKLTVPETLGNEYAYREGEVDWVFTFEAGNDPEDAAPKTGDYIMVAFAVMALSGIALVAVAAVKRRKRK